MRRAKIPPVLLPLPHLADGMMFATVRWCLCGIVFAVSDPICTAAGFQAGNPLQAYILTYCYLRLWDWAATIFFGMICLPACPTNRRGPGKGLCLRPIECWIPQFAVHQRQTLVPWAV